MMRKCQRMSLLGLLENSSTWNLKKKSNKESNDDKDGGMIN